MFKDVLNFNTTTREALRDPATAIQRGLARLQEQIDKNDKKIAKLQADISQAQSTKIGWLERMATSSAESLIKNHQQKLDEARALATFLSTPLYANVSNWTFEQVDGEIVTLYRRLAGSYAALEAAVAPTQQLQDPAQNIKIKFGKGAEQDMPELVVGLQTILGALGATQDLDTTLLTVCKLTVELQGLYAERRALFKSFLQDVQTWDQLQLEVALRKRRRDFEDLPTELRQQKDYSHLADMSAIVASLLEQRRFLEDVIFELEGALSRFKKASDPTADILKQIKELRRKMDAAVANETDPDLQTVIKQAYGKKIDDLMEKL
jgi:hypothetical protein